MLLALDLARSVIGALPVKVVPIGVQQSKFQEFVDSSFSNYQVLEPVDWLPMEAGKAVFINYDYLWNQPGCEHLWNYYKQVVME